MRSGGWYATSISRPCAARVRSGDSRHGLPRSRGSRADACARAFDRAQADAHLRLARGVGELFDGMAIAVAAVEIHPRVVTAGIAPAGPARPGSRVRRSDSSPASRTAAGSRSCCPSRPGRSPGVGTRIEPRPRRSSRLAASAVSTCACNDSDARIVLQHALPQLRDEGAVERRRQRLRAAPASSSSRAVFAARRAARARRMPSVRILTFSSKASLSMIGHAHSSPSVSGATVW